MIKNKSSEIQKIINFSNKHSPVFVVGVERGGTSMVHKAIGAHTAFIPVNSTLETFIFDNPSLQLSNPGEMTKQYLENNNFKEYYESLEGNWANSWGENRKIISSFFYYAFRYIYNNARIIEKTPRHVFKIDLIFRSFPKAKVIAVYREPFGVIDSYRKRLERERKLGLTEASWGWLNKTPEQICSHLEKIAKAIEAGHQRYPRKLIKISYDGFLNEPELALKIISNFIDVSPVIRPKIQRKMVSESSDVVDPLLAANQGIYINKPIDSESLLTVEDKYKLVNKFPYLFDKFSLCKALPSSKNANS